MIILPSMKTECEDEWHQHIKCAKNKSSHMINVRCVFAITTNFLISWELLLLFDHFSLLLFDHFDFNKLELNGSSLLYQNLRLSTHHGHRCARMKFVTVHTFHREVILLHSLIVWLCGELNHSRERVNPESLYNLNVSTNYFVRNTVWWVVFINGGHSSNFVESCQ